MWAAVYNSTATKRGYMHLLDNCPNSDGMIPVKSLFQSSSLAKRDSLPSSVGRVPLSLASCTSNATRLDKRPTSLGSCPATLVAINRQKLKFRLPITDGIPPDSISLYEKSSTLREESKAISGGIEPDNWFLNSHRCFEGNDQMGVSNGWCEAVPSFVGLHTCTSS